MLSPEIIGRAVTDRDNLSVGHVVRELTPIIQASVTRTLFKWQSRAQGRVMRQEVEDLTQEVFACLLEKNGAALKGWDPDQGSAKVYFGVITARRVHNILESRKRNPWTEAPVEDTALDPETDFDGTCDTDMERQIVSRELLRSLSERLLCGLNANNRRLFELLYIRNLDDDVARNELGISRDALYQARGRLLKRVRDLVGDLDAEYQSMIGMRS